MVMISERPPEVEDRAVPGHWEGDLLTGKNKKSAIGTLVERSSRYVILLHLPNGHGAEEVEKAITAAAQQLPETLRRSLTWDQGHEMANHLQLKIATGLDVYFCDPHSPWQRGSNENTNGLLRQYFPKGQDLSHYGPDYLAFVSAQMNRRPSPRNTILGSEFTQPVGHSSRRTLRHWPVSGFAAARGSGEYKVRPDASGCLQTATGKLATSFTSHLAFLKSPQ